MIITLIVAVISLVFQLIFMWFPIVTISSIPVIGSGLSAILISMVSVWNAFMITFPYAVVVWHILVFVVIPFESLLLLAKFLLGSRVPVQTTN